MSQTIAEQVKHVKKVFDFLEYLHNSISIILDSRRVTNMSIGL